MKRHGPASLDGLFDRGILDRILGNTNVCIAASTCDLENALSYPVALHMPASSTRAANCGGVGS